MTDTLSGWLSFGSLNQGVHGHAQLEIIFENPTLKNAFPGILGLKILTLEG